MIDFIFKERLIKMLSTYPNDLELGKEVRRLVKEWEGETSTEKRHGENFSIGYGDEEDDDSNHNIIKPDDSYNDDDYDY